VAQEMGETLARSAPFILRVGTAAGLRLPSGFPSESEDRFVNHCRLIYTAEY